MDVQKIFLKAVEKTNPAERDAYLEGVCGQNVELRAQIEQLLSAHEKSEGFLERPLFDADATQDRERITETPGEMIGSYRLLQQIGEGGFGVVFMAEQQRPVVRKVALKIVKPGMDTKEVVARFEAERQALALMDHPNIARVFDGGETSSGRPYFVMELIRGIPITEFCDQQQLVTQERLMLFASICRAVQHAHQKGIIHRDIKPNNILVTLHDGTPLAKVIDFGVAKAIGQPLTAKTLFTRFSQMVGTPLYMSPEQAALSAVDVDTRADIYALGVLLYELLTGATPFDRKRLQTAAYDEIRRIIREEEPMRPSKRISTLGDALGTVCTCRQTEPSQLTRLVEGDLDWIVMKALDKSRDRRYETASAFAADINHYMRHEPVTACPPTLAYRLRKLWRRNSRLVSTATVLLIALVSGLVGTSWQWYRADKAAENARIAQAQADEQKSRAIEASESATQNANRYRALLYLSDIPRALQSYERGELARTRMLLNRHQKEYELHGVEWTFLNNAMNRLDECTKVACPAVFKGFAIAPAARLGAVHTNDKKIRLFDLQEREWLAEFDADSAISSLYLPIALSPDGKRLAYRSRSDELTLYDIANDTTRLIHVTAGIESLEYSPDGQLLAVDYLPDEFGIELRRCDDQEIVAHIPVLNWGKPRFSPDSRYLVCSTTPTSSSEGGNQIIIWEIETGRIVHKLEGGSAICSSFAFSPDGQLLATGGYDQKIQIWNVTDFSHLATLEGHLGTVFTLAFSPSSDLLVSGSRDHTARVWKMDGFQEAFVLRGSERRVNSVGFLDDGSTVVTGGHDSICFWSLPHCTPVRRLNRPTLVYQVAFADETRVFYREDASSQLREFDVETLEDRAFAQVAGELSGFAISSNGLVATVSSLGKVEVFDVITGKRSVEFSGSGPVAFSQDGTQLFCASDQGIRMVSTSQPAVTHVISQIPCTGLMIRGQIMASRTQINTLAVWKLDSEHHSRPSKLADIENAEGKSINGFDLSSDGAKAVIYDENGAISTWDTKTGRMLAVQNGAETKVLNVKMSLDDEFVLSTGYDCYVTLWNSDDLTERFRFPRLNGAGSSLAISPSGRWLASCTYGGEIRVLEIGSRSNDHRRLP